MEIRGLTELLKSMMLVDQKVRGVVTTALTFGSGKIRTRAQEYCPISPTQAQKNRLRKTTRKVTRKATTISRVKPGGLRRSIDFEVDRDALSASIFVASNSEGGAYAQYIHDGRGTSWNNLGPGSVAANKSGEVDGKFIERAVNAEAEELLKYIDAKLRKITL